MRQCCCLILSQGRATSGRMTKSGPETPPGAPATPDSAAPAPRKPLSPAAERALAEAAARRAERDKQAPASREVKGRAGPDPVRYGDWEVKGIASDF
jgi:hypothetical protein